MTNEELLAECDGATGEEMYIYVPNDSAYRLFGIRHLHKSGVFVKVSAVRTAIAMDRQKEKIEVVVDVQDNGKIDLRAESRR